MSEYEIYNNLPSSFQLIDFCSKINVNKFILISSGGTVYGNSSCQILNENSDTNPVSPYGISKLFSEKFALFYHNNFELPLIIIRPSNPYGLNQIKKNEQGFIGVAINCLVNSEPINIYGKNGTIRDYIFIDDLSYGIFYCLKYGKISQTYNIGTGVGTNNLFLLSLIENKFSKKFTRINILDKRPFDVDSNVLDYKKLFLHTGWAPKISILDGIDLIYKEYSK